MSEDQIAHLIRNILLLSFIGGALIFRFRGRIGVFIRQAGLWALIVLAIVVGYGIWQDIAPTTSRQAVFTDEGRIAVPRSPDGHYHMTMSVEGTPVRFIVDTGATDIVLSREDAERIGIDTARLAFFSNAQTANGTVATAMVTLKRVSIGEIADQNVPARVNGGDMSGSLLGMRYLERFASLEIRDGMLTLTR